MHDSRAQRKMEGVNENEGKLKEAEAKAQEQDKALASLNDELAALKAKLAEAERCVQDVYIAHLRAHADPTRCVLSKMSLMASGFASCDIISCDTRFETQ